MTAELVELQRHADDIPAMMRALADGIRAGTVEAQAADGQADHGDQATQEAG